MIDCRRAVGPCVTAVLRDVDNHSVLSAGGSSEANTVERKMSVISNTIIAEREHVVSLNEIFRIGCGNSFPGLAAVERDVVITASARFRWAPCLKRGRDHVVGILRV